MKHRIHWSLALSLCAGVVGAGCSDAAATQSPGANAPVVSDATGNRTPEIRSLQLDPREPAVGDTLRVVARVHDQDGDKVELRVRWFVDGERLPESGESIELVDVAKGSSIDVRVEASDGKSSSKPAEASAQVIDRPPLIRGIAVSPPDSVYPGDEIRITPDASDPDQDSLSFQYEWYVNDQRLPDVEGRILDTSSLKRGDEVWVRVVASDGRNESQPMETGVVQVSSAHPEITANQPGLSDDGVFRYDVKAADPDGDRRLRYQLAAGPSGMEIDNISGELIWRPSTEQAGIHAVGIVVTDSSGLETRQSFEVTVAQSGSAPASQADSQ
jgi:hypothetical protein